MAKEQNLPIKILIRLIPSRFYIDYKIETVRENQIKIRELLYRKRYTRSKTLPRCKVMITKLFGLLKI